MYGHVDTGHVGSAARWRSSKKWLGGLLLGFLPAFLFAFRSRRLRRRPLRRQTELERDELHLVGDGARVAVGDGRVRREPCLRTRMNNIEYIESCSQISEFSAIV